jgi:hypothetical protein
MRRKLKLILKKQNVKVRRGFNYLGYGSMAGFCEDRDETLGSRKAENSLRI